jgi:hypothetical protein
LSEFLHQIGIVIGNPAAILEEARAAMKRVVGGINVEILEKERHATERAGTKFLRRRGTRLFVQRNDHGVQLRVQPLDSADRRLDQFDGLRLALANQIGLRGGVHVLQFGCHGAAHYERYGPQSRQAGPAAGPSVENRGRRTQTAHPNSLALGRALGSTVWHNAVLAD